MPHLYYEHCKLMKLCHVRMGVTILVATKFFKMLHLYYQYCKSMKLCHVRMGVIILVALGRVYGRVLERQWLYLSTMLRNTECYNIVNVGRGIYLCIIIEWFAT